MSMKLAGNVIVIIEDDDAIYNICVKCLGMLDVHKVDVVRFITSDLAWIFLEPLLRSSPEKIKFILADVNQPKSDMDGLDVLRKSRILHEKIVFIIMSGIPGNAEEATTLKADAFLVKAFSAADLIKTLKNFM